MTLLTSCLWRRFCRLGASALFLIAIMSGVGMAWACNVPVFRYALERWQPDPYRATLFHRGPLSEEQKSLLGRLSESSGQAHLNLVLRLVDVDDVQEEADRALFAAQSAPRLPWLTVQYPQSLRNEQAIWVEPLSDGTAKALVASPLREELIRRLAEGQTAVWLMLECGRADQDDAVAAQLLDELDQLSQQLQLPDLTTAPEDELLSDAPLKVTFSLLRVPRGLAAERPLIEMLLHSEFDLVDFDEPMVFPVFGRGRALLPLIGAGITADNIQEAAGFLVGECSCEIKALNPGFDLLLEADWDALLFKGALPREIAATRRTVASGKPELVAIPVGATSTPTDSDASPAPHEVLLERNYVRIAIVCFMLSAAAVLVKRFV